MFFFFQAEDGIRDLVRSRGLGDVYKRQVLATFDLGFRRAALRLIPLSFLVRLGFGAGGEEPVSYTHLTLPTSDLV